MFALELKESGAQDFQLALVGAEKVLSDWRPAFQKLAPQSAIMIHTVFEQEGPGWLELKPSTLKEKEKHFPGKTILRRTDRLYHSFEEGAADNVTRLEELTAEFGSAVPYGIYHQETRPIIHITPGDELQLVVIAVHEQNQRLEALGWKVN